MTAIFFKGFVETFILTPAFKCAIPNAITTWRDGIRTKQAAMETAVTNASNTPALETLYTYVNTADEGDPEVYERPLGEFPELGS